MVSRIASRSATATARAATTSHTTATERVTSRRRTTATDRIDKPVATEPLKPAASTAYPKLVGLIDSSKSRLYLHLVDLHDPDVFAHLMDAQKRGVDLHVVITPSGRLPQEEVQRVNALSDAGADIAVKNKTALAERSGVSDGTAFVAGKTDPVAGEGPAKTTEDPAKVAKEVAAFGAALEPKVVGNIHKGLLRANRVEVHAMPESTSAPILNALNSAKKSIDLEVYQLTDRGVIDALKAAQARGVKVRVMVEPKTVEPSNYPTLSKELAAAGIDIQPTPPRFDSKHNVDHAKFMLIDNKELLFGTGNLVRSGLGGNDRPEANNRDFWTEDTRTVSLTEASSLFNADWARQPTEGMVFKNLVVTPDDAVGDISSVIGSATKQLRVYNQSLSDKKTIDELLAAKARGVDVKVLLGVQQTGAGKPPKNQPAVDALKAAGIQVEYLTHNYLHAKAVVADDHVFLGSQNFTSGGLDNNREVGEVFDYKPLVKNVIKTFDADFTNPGPQP